ncbi:MAG: DnaT-like ssDNA-binding domain-containing protein [Pseudohaliea sp.]
MAESSLIPEQQLLFSPGLAATIGLEEAILLQYLHGLLGHPAAERQGPGDWVTVARGRLLSALPFWSDADLSRLCKHLVDLGVMQLREGPENDTLTFALDHGPATGAGPAESTRPRQGALAGRPGASKEAPVQRAPVAMSAAPATAGAGGGLARRPGAGLLPAGWQPSEDLLQLLALNHNIPRAFALEQLEDFVFYWRERGESSHAWENKFRQHVLSCWRRRQQDAAEAFRSTPAPLDGNWQPNADALEILLRAGVARDFIEDSIPEFVLYWRERGSTPETLNTRFVQHIRRQWARYQSSREHGTEPVRIPPDWQPSADVFDILALSHIDTGFARALVPEFVLYWRDSNQLHSSWNSKFLQHVKYHWARHNQFTARDGRHDGQQGTGGAGRTRDRSLEQDLHDTSWAD